MMARRSPQVDLFPEEATAANAGSAPARELSTVVVNIHHRVPYDVYVGRAGQGQDGYFGNPFAVKAHGAAALQLYRADLRRRVGEEEGFVARALSLHGKVLGCFCVRADGRGECHAKILAAFVDALWDLRALTLWRPWPWSILRAGKGLENRPWACPAFQIGRWLLIHAGAKWDEEGAQFILEHTADMGTAHYGTHTSWRMPPEAQDEGLVGAVRVTGVLDKAAGAAPPEGQAVWYFGPFAWVLSDPVPFARPVAARGFQGLWHPEHAALVQLPGDFLARLVA